MTDSQIKSIDSAILDVDVQYAHEDSDGEGPPSPELIQQWAQSAYAVLDNGELSQAEVTVRIVSSKEIQSLNHQYRGKDQATNVLSFPFENEFSDIAELDLALLGDIVLGHEVIVQEALTQDKQLHHHYAHMVIHGVLHLNGFEHDKDDEALKMESLETKILATQGVPNPYSAT